MTINEKIRACNDFLMSLAEELKDAGYEMVEVDTPYQAYLIDKSNLEVIADEVGELLDNGT